MGNRNIISYDNIDSTNARMKEFAKEGAAHGTVIVAESQNAGVGRRGRVWESPVGDNLYMTLLLRPQIETDKASMLTLVMAHSIAKVLRHLGFADTKIKWPNDLILNQKKVCGILTEMALKGTEIDYVLIGVGINVNQKTFPASLQKTATSLLIESNRNVDKTYLLECILDMFDTEYNTFLACKDLSFMKESYEDMLVNREKEVRVLEPEQEFSGIALGINEQGELIVQKEDGSQQAIYAGEVSVRGVYGYV